MKKRTQLWYEFEGNEHITSCNHGDHFTLSFWTDPMEQVTLDMGLNGAEKLLPQLIEQIATLRVHLKGEELNGRKAA